MRRSLRSGIVLRVDFLHLACSGPQALLPLHDLLFSLAALNTQVLIPPLSSQFSLGE